MTEPDGFVVTVGSDDRLHFLDWGGPADDPAPTADPAAMPGVVLVHGLSQTAWIWTPVARRLRDRARTIAMDLRGHGLSDAPTEDDAYDLPVLGEDVIAVAEGSGALDPEVAAGSRVVLAGHGFGAIVAAEAARALGGRCAGLILVDGGWESLQDATGMDADEFLRGLDEPPEVMASLDAFLADRAAFDPATWDADQDRAARATVVETHAGRVVPATRPHALEACVRTMFTYEPMATLPEVEAPITVLMAADDEERTRARALDAVVAALRDDGGPEPVVRAFGHVGHNLMRYRPDDVTAAILAAAR
jgi:pimeloyl-ACP methyl ester carboxylesterase